MGIMSLQVASGVTVVKTAIKIKAELAFGEGKLCYGLHIISYYFLLK
jgi:hypothetical protein